VRTDRPPLSDVNEKQQQLSQTNFMKYVNYLSMNGHKALIRSQFQDGLLQMDHWAQKEKQDLEKLEVVFQYLKELNFVKKDHLDYYENQIKSKTDERNNLIVEQYNQHIHAGEKEVAKQWEAKEKAIKQLQQQVLSEQQKMEFHKYHHQQWQQQK
jgi:hypothetical protein